MGEFSYKAKDLEGQTLTGLLDAPDEEAALVELSRRGYAVLSLESSEEKPTSGWFRRIYKAPVDTLLTFFTQFSFLVRSGVPLFQSLEMVIAQTEDWDFRDILKSIKKNLAEGESLANSLRQHPTVFTDLHISMVVVGESSGRISHALDRIVTLIQDEKALWKKIKKATTYPLVVLSLGLVTTFGILTAVVPRFAKIYDKSEMQLPATTSLVLGLSSFVRDNLIEIGLGAGLLVLGGVFFVKTSRGKFLLDSLKFRLPILGQLVQSIHTANFSRTLGSLLNSGVPLVKSLEICRDTTSNLAVRPVLADLVERVKEGESMAETMGRHKIFPQVLVQLTAIGEESGRLDVVMDNVHGYYQERVEDSLNKFTGFIEPALLILLASMVLIMAMALFLPVFQLPQTLRRG